MGAHWPGLELLYVDSMFEVDKIEQALDGVKLTQGTEDGGPRCTNERVGYGCSTTGDQRVVECTIS